MTKDDQTLKRMWEGPNAEKKKKPFRFGDRVGHSLAILVGGEREQLLAQRGEHTVFVSKRKGHVR